MCRCFLSLGVKVKCHLDMDARTLSFTVGGKLFKDIVVDLPGEVWPGVDMRSAGLSAKLIGSAPQAATETKKAGPVVLGFAGASPKFDSSVSVPVVLSENDTVCKQAGSEKGPDLKPIMCANVGSVP
jgi:hypothetical protein